MQTAAMSVVCACGGGLDTAMDCRVVGGRPYSVLFKLVDEVLQESLSVIHSTFERSSYVYGFKVWEIREQLGKIKTLVRSKFQEHIPVS